jgi:hypothetical protein
VAQIEHTYFEGTIGGINVIVLFLKIFHMQYTATIEIPKASDRRIHMRYDKTGFIDLGPISEHITVNGGVMPVHYGYIAGLLTKMMVMK